MWSGKATELRLGGLVYVGSVRPGGPDQFLELGLPDCTDFTPTTGYTSSMTVLPFTDARNRLSELIDEVARTHERVEITRHGHPVAVLISADDLAALEETLDVLSSPEAMRQLAESRAAVEAGDVLDSDELAALVAKRSRRAR